MSTTSCDQTPVFVTVHETVTLGQSTNSAISPADATPYTSFKSDYESTKSIVTTMITETSTEYITKTTILGIIVSGPASTTSSGTANTTDTTAVLTSSSYLPLNFTYAPSVGCGTLCAPSVYPLTPNNTSIANSATTAFVSATATAPSAEPTISILTLGSAANNCPAGLTVMLALAALLGWIHA